MGMVTGLQGQGMNVASGLQNQGMGMVTDVTGGAQKEDLMKKVSFPFFNNPSWCGNQRAYFRKHG